MGIKSLANTFKLEKSYKRGGAGEGSGAIVKKVTRGESILKGSDKAKMLKEGVLFY